MKPPLTDFPSHETERLRILPLRSTDAEALRALTDDPAVTGAIDFLSSPFQLADAQALIRSNDDENCFLGAWDDAALIGVVGAHARGDDRIEIGYWIGTRFQGRGLATEAVLSVIRRLRQMHPERQIVAECRRSNQASWRLLLRLGFRPTGQQGQRRGRELLALADT